MRRSIFHGTKFRRLRKAIDPLRVFADYDAKRSILSTMLESARLNSEKLDFSLRKPFDLLRDEKLVPSQWSQRDTSETRDGVFERISAN